VLPWCPFARSTPAVYCDTYRLYCNLVYCYPCLTRLLLFWLFTHTLVRYPLPHDLGRRYGLFFVVAFTRCGSVTHGFTCGCIPLYAFFPFVGLPSRVLYLWLYLGLVPRLSLADTTRFVRAAAFLPRAHFWCPAPHAFTGLVLVPVVLVLWFTHVWTLPLSLVRVAIVADTFNLPGSAYLVRPHCDTGSPVLRGLFAPTVYRCGLVVYGLPDAGGLLLFALYYNPCWTLRG